MIGSSRPGHGKPVEINALWYSNLRVMALLAVMRRMTSGARTFTALAQRVADVFERAYFNARPNA